MTERYLHLMIEESSDLADFLSTLEPGDWDRPSLCAGWRVRDVVAHMVAGHTASIPSFAASLARHGFNTDRTSDSLARDLAGRTESDALVSGFRAATSGAPRGAARLVPVSELFTDHLVHHQDIRRALDKPRTVPRHRIEAALETLPRLSGRVGSRRRIKGLRLAATDLPYFHGEGPEVQGTAEALLLVATGRGAPVPELTGPGAAQLAARVAA